MIYAQEQYGGRGQAGNRWITEAGKNITLSIILYPHFLTADQQFFLNMAVSLGIKDFCEAVLQREITLKWPNDIYFDNYKLGGLLLENTINGNRISSTVAGIGLNVNQTVFADSLPNPTSMSLISGKQYDLSLLVESLCSYVEKYYLQLRQFHFNFLDKAYMESLYRYQQTHDFKKGTQIIRGEINGVTKEGKLVIHSKGKEHRFFFKEVEYVL